MISHNPSHRKSKATKSKKQLPKVTPLRVNTVTASYLERYSFFGFLILVILPFLFFSRSVSCTFYISKSAVFAWAWMIFGIPALWLLRDSRVFDRLKTPISGSLLLFALTLVLSTVFSITPLVSLFGVYERQMGVMTQIQAISMTFLTIIILNDEKKIYLFADLLIIAASINAIVAIFQFFGIDFTGLSILLGTRAYGLQGQPDLFGSVMMFAVFLNFARVFSSGTSVKRMAFWLALLIQTIGIILSLTRGAWIGYIVGLLVFIVMVLSFPDKEHRKYHFKLVLVSLSLILTICIGSILIFSDVFIPRIMSLLQFKGTSATRLLLWQETLRFSWENTIHGKLFGVGPEVFRRAFMPFKPLQLSQLEPNVNYDDPHNNYLGILVKMGITGLLAWITIWFFAARSIFRVFKQDLSSDEKILLAGLVAALLAYAVNALTIFDTVVSLVFFGVFLGIVVSLSNIVADKAVGKQNAGIMPPGIIVAQKAKHRTSWQFFVIMTMMSVLTVINGIYYFKAWVADNNFLYGIRGIKYYDSHHNAMTPSNRIKFLGIILSRIDAAMVQNPIESHYAIYYTLASNYYYDASKNQFIDVARSQLNEGIKRLLAYKNITWEPENLYMALSDSYITLNDTNNAIKYLRIVVDEWDHQKFYTRYNLAVMLDKRADQMVTNGDIAGARNDLSEALDELIKGMAVIFHNNEFKNVYVRMVDLEKKIKENLKKIE